MGSSKKHKEKRDKKKHKKARSRSRSYERDSHKRSHKSSQKDRERRRSRERYVDEASSSKTSEKKRFDDNRPENRRDSEPCPNELAALALKYSEKKRTLTRESENLPRTVIGSRSSDLSDEDFDIDRLLEDKLSENPEFASRKFPIRKRVSEGNNQSLVVQINNERKRPYVDSEDSLEKFATEQFFEEHGIPLENLSEQGQSIVIRRNFSPQQESSHFSEEYESDISHNRSYSMSQSSERNYEDLPGSGTKEKDGPLPPKRIKIKEEPKDYGSSHQQNVKENEEASSLIGGNSGQSQLSLSIADANKLRAKLGLKPLNIPEAIPGLGSGDAENEPSETATKEVFVKTENISEQKKAEKLREKLSTMKEKRKITEKLRKVKPLAESDSEDDSAANWVKKSRKLEKEKEQAEKTAKLLEEMDAEFGVGALMEEEFEKKKAYTSRDLRGLTVGHDSGVFKEGRHVILTLKDKDVLNEDDDVLQNVNLLDEERYAKNIENKKKKPAYRPYDEPEFDEFGILKKQTLLSKYDEEIEGAKKKTFTLGSNTYRDKEKEIEMIRMKLKQQQGVSLEMTNVRVASEYYTPDEMVQFKKPKKKVRKVRKREMLKADDLLSDLTELPERDFGTRNSAVLIDKEREDQFLYGDTATSVPAVVEMKEVEEEDDIVIPEDLSGIVVDEDHAEKELHLALHKARKLKQRKTLTVPEKVIETIKNANAEEMDTKEAGKAGSIVLNSTAEFCRTLGDIPTYGMSGNRDEEADELIDFERELMEERQRQEMEAQNRGAWNEVDIDEKPAEIVIRENEPILEEEPDISLGVAGALTLAKKKGYLDKDTKKLSGAPRTSTLQAQSYTIEEKFYEDDKFGKRDRYTGPIQDFREKGAYRPDVKLEYIDDSGRLLTAKEAFRYLSHKFHGKGPGKNKVDKRMKKLDQDTRLKQMSSTDTPLNTVKLLQAKQKETQSPYIVLSGGSRTLTQTMISKTKPT